MERTLASCNTIRRGCLSGSTGATTAAPLVRTRDFGVAYRRGRSENVRIGLRERSIVPNAEVELAEVFILVARSTEDLSSFPFSFRSLFCFSNRDEVGVRVSSGDGSSSSSSSSSSEVRRDDSDKDGQVLSVCSVSDKPSLITGSGRGGAHGGRKRKCPLKLPGA